MKFHEPFKVYVFILVVLFARENESMTTQSPAMQAMCIMDSLIPCIGNKLSGWIDTLKKVSANADDSAQLRKALCVDHRRTLEDDIKKGVACG
ncbi:uncharacterized protein LOC141910235 isoform X2 [Tubulanus polymorphus]|uniref:uncharacterized protein LOC141910235 isoform X2 n=1 Tax=Tubulanus polymorphus TaxID=672921 RepID=UPI003DA1F47E